GRRRLGFVFGAGSHRTDARDLRSAGTCVRVLHLRHVRVFESGGGTRGEGGLRADSRAGAAVRHRCNAAQETWGPEAGGPGIGSGQIDAGDGNHARAKRRGRDTRRVRASRAAGRSADRNRGDAADRDLRVRGLASAVPDRRESLRQPDAEAGARMKYGMIPEGMAERVALRMGRIPAPVIDVLYGPLQARAIMAAANVGVFDALAKGPAGAADLAVALRVDAGCLEALLRTLVHAGYLRLDGN